MKFELTRVWKDEKQTLGQLDVINNEGEIVFTCYTLELPDLNNDGIEGNERRKSCIPDGVYPCRLFKSPKFGHCFAIDDVPGRSQIRIHPGVHYLHTLGCILPGTDQFNINSDDLLDNYKSRAAMRELLKYEPTTIEVNTI